MSRFAMTQKAVRWMVASAVVVILSGCGGKHYLAHYQFADRSMALVYIEPPSPQLLHGWYNLDVGQTAIQTAVRATAGAAKEIEARRAMARLDSASWKVNVQAKLAQRTLERASRYLGTQPVATSVGADFVLEINMRKFGIDAQSSRATYLYTRAEAVLIERRTGREVWSEEVWGSTQLTPWVNGTANVPSAIFTAATLHTVSVADFAEALDQLVTYTSNLITNELREKLRDVRDPDK
jgi:ABC-type uncharacterized transport system auxiliary subunit